MNLLVMMETWVALPSCSLGPATASRPKLLESVHADIAAAQHGDLDAAARLIEAYHPRIARLVYAILLNRADVDDVTQHVFVRMCQRIGTLRSPDLFEAWLYQLARRIALDFLRREKFRRLFSPLESLLGEPAVAPPPPTQLKADEITELIASLSVSDRELILLAGEGYTYEEIALLQKKSRASIKARLARVREWLRAELANT